MFVILSITLKTFKFLTLLQARAATTKGRARGRRPPKHKATVVENSGKYCKPT